MTKKEPPLFLKASTMVPVVRHKTRSNYGEPGKEQVDLQLGLYYSSKGGHPVYTSYKVYCYEPEWDYPDFKVRIVMANGTGHSVLATLPLQEYKERLAKEIQWLKDNKLWHDKAETLSKELNRRHVIQSHQTEVLSNLNFTTEELEQKIISHHSNQRELQTKQHQLANFLYYFKTYFDTDDPIHKRQCLDFMLSLLPNYTSEVLELLAKYQHAPTDVLETNLHEIKEKLQWLFDDNSNKVEDLESQYMQIPIDNEQT